jgi:2-methylcitrate dehydratase PrpD
MAERCRSDGAMLLRAVILGYDITARFSLSLRPYQFRSVGHSTHSLAPTFGAAAAAAMLAGLDARGVRHALSYAAQQASGISCYTRDPDHIEKAFDFGGMPARNGVTAAAMVASGFTGVDDALFGERSFFVANDEAARIGLPPDPEILVQDLGKTFEIMRTNIKRWSVGSPIQAPLDSLHALIGTEKIAAGDIERLTIRVSELGANTTDDKDMPDICMQHMCAVMLLDGTASFEAAHDVARMRDKDVLALRKRIVLVGDEALQKLLPERHGIVEARLRDGRTLVHHTSQVRGTAGNPMSREEIEEKCVGLMAPSIGESRARRLCRRIWSIEAEADVAGLASMLRC